MEAKPFVSPRMLWMSNFIALALTLFGLMQVVASKGNPAMTFAIFTAPIATLMWLYHRTSPRVRLAALVLNSLLLAWQLVYMAFFVVLTRVSSSEPQVAGYAFMVFTIAICTLNLVGMAQRPNNSFKPKPLRGSA